MSFCGITALHVLFSISYSETHCYGDKQLPLEVWAHTHREINVWQQVLPMSSAASS